MPKQGKYLVITSDVFSVTTKLLPTLTKVKTFVAKLDKNEYRVFCATEQKEIRRCDLAGRSTTKD